MTKPLSRAATACVALGFLTLPFVGCDKDSLAENAGEAVEEAADEVGDAVEKATD